MFGRNVLKAALVLAAVLVSGLATATAWADTSGHGEQHVYVIVDSNITIGGLATTPPGGSGGTPGNGSTVNYVNLGRVQTGLFCGWIRWRVDANTEAIRFYVGASDLWKGDDPRNASVQPIPLYRQGGVEIDIELGRPALGQDDRVNFIGQTTLGDFPAYTTENVTFESSQNGHFSQYVTTHVCWFQDDPEKPTGQYSGVVALWGFVVPHL